MGARFYMLSWIFLGIIHVSHLPNISNEIYAPGRGVMNTGAKEVPRPIEWTRFLIANTTKNGYSSDIGIEKRSTNFELARHHNTNKCSSTNSSVENPMLEDDLRYFSICQF